MTKTISTAALLLSSVISVSALANSDSSLDSLATVGPWIQDVQTLGTHRINNPGPGNSIEITEVANSNPDLSITIKQNTHSSVDTKISIGSATSESYDDATYLCTIEPLNDTCYGLAKKDTLLNGARLWISTGSLPSGYYKQITYNEKPTRR